MFDPDPRRALCPVYSVTLAFGNKHFVRGSDMLPTRGEGHLGRAKGCLIPFQRGWHSAGTVLSKREAGPETEASFWQFSL